MNRAQERPDGGCREAAGSSAQCVWMLAGVVSYRLCNRAFDCDHCPLDRALREGARGVDSHERLKSLTGRRTNF
jgi:hypothetical protein